MIKLYATRSTNVKQNTVATAIAENDYQKSSFIEAFGKDYYIYSQAINQDNMYAPITYVSSPENHIFCALVFGTDIYRSDIDHSLTIELSPEQHREYTLMANNDRVKWLKDIAGVKANNYRMWLVHTPRPMWKDGLTTFDDYTYISCPPCLETSHNRKLKKDVLDDDRVWLNEIAMMNGMGFGVQGYNDTMGF